MMSLRFLFKPFNIFFAFFILSACAHQRTATIAVWNLDDLSPSTIVRPEIGELLSGEIINAVNQKGEYSVVERERLLLALEELNLGAASFVDETTRLRLGRLSGARFMIFGGYQIIGSTMRLDLQLIEVETGKLQKAVQKTIEGSDLSKWLKNAEEAAEELLYP